MSCTLLGPAHKAVINFFDGASIRRNGLAWNDGRGHLIAVSGLLPFDYLNRDMDKRPMKAVS
jgi:hypothetical protein